MDQRNKFKTPKNSYGYLSVLWTVNIWLDLYASFQLHLASVFCFVLFFSFAYVFVSLVGWVFLFLFLVLFFFVGGGGGGYGLGFL